MSTSIDNRIVAMKIDNQAFNQGAATTLSFFDKLKSAMNFTSSTNSISEAQRAANGFNLNPISASIESVNKAFLGMATIAVTALSNIVNRAVDAGIQITKSLTIDPLSGGLSEYETNLNSIQTILANTEVSGATLDDVNNALQQLNTYSDKTIYNFSQMARNIGTFTAAGVGLQDSVDSIKGIANLAAVSGSSAEQASSAMYQLSQAIASGRVSLMDWNSVVNAGMGGTVFQRALAQTAVAMGEIDEKAVSLSGDMKNVQINGQSFRDSISTAGGGESWLTSKVLTNTLAQFTGDLSKAELAAQGFNDAQIKAIQEQAKSAVEAATQVKTLSGVIDTARETAGSGWSKTWQLIFGDFDQAKTTFTNLSNTINGFISANANARNKMLKDWNAIGKGGRRVLINGLKNAFDALLSVLEPIHDAFRDIFPPVTGRQLYHLTQLFRRFTKSLILSEESQKNLKAIFKAFFSIIDFGIDIVKGLLGYLFEFGDSADDVGSSILGLIASVAKLVTKFHDWVEQGDFIGRFFDKIQEGRAAVLTPVLEVVSMIIDAFKALITSGPEAFFNGLADAVSYLGGIADSFVDGLSSMKDAVVDFVSNLGFGDLLDFGGTADQISSGISKVKDATVPLADAGDLVSRVWGVLDDVFKGIFVVVGAIGIGIGKVFGYVKDQLSNGAESMGLDDVLAIVNTGFFIAFYSMLRSFLGSLKSVTDSMAGAGDAVRGTLDQLTSNLKTMQTDIRANILLKIAGAVALLAAGIYVLSKVDGKGLAKGLAAVSVLLAEMVAGMIALEKGTKGIGIVGSGRMLAISTGLIGLSTAVIAMAGAVALFGQMDSDKMNQGLKAVAAVIAVTVGASVALAKGGGGVALIGAATGLTILAAALVAFAGAVKLYQQINTNELLNGGLKIAASLAAIAFVMNMFGPQTFVNAAGLVLITASLIALAGALKIFGNMSVEEIAKSMIVLGGALFILTAALTAFTVVGEAAPMLALVAVAMVPFALAMKMLGSISWKGVAVGLTVLAGVLTILGVAAAIFTATGLIVVLPVLAGSIAALGAAMFLAGAGMFLFAAGLASLAVSGVAGAAALGAVIIAIGETLPLLAQQFGLAIKAFAAVIAESGPEFVDAAATLMDSIFRAIIREAPVAGEAFVVVITTALKAIRDLSPDFQETGFQVLMDFLTGVDKHIEEITTMGTRIVAKFIRALGENSEEITQAGADAVIDFIHGLADTIRTRSDDLADAGFDLGEAIAEGMVNGIKASAGKAVEEGGGLGFGVLGAIASAIDSHSPSKKSYKLGQYVAEGFSNGIRDSVKGANGNAEKLGTNTIDSIKKAISKAKEEMPNSIDTSPKITPVIDLSEVKKGAAQIKNALGDAKIGAGTALRQAGDISRRHDQGKQNDGDRSDARPEIKFEQTINAPTDPTPIEIYRNTKNLISLAKEALDNS